LEDQFQTRWLAFDHPLHTKCCSVRCPQRTSSRAARSAETADATVKSAEDSGRYSTARPARASTRSFA
jgi:hypothetical protein